VKEPFGMMARLKEPVDFEAVDEQPVDLVFLLLVPEPSQSRVPCMMSINPREISARCEPMC
jgi:nitrogen PTS system EIIA component